MHGRNGANTSLVDFSGHSLLRCIPTVIYIKRRVVVETSSCSNVTAANISGWMSFVPTAFGQRFVAQTFHLVGLPGGVFQGELFHRKCFFTKRLGLVGLLVVRKLTWRVSPRAKSWERFPHFPIFQIYSVVWTGVPVYMLCFGVLLSHSAWDLFDFVHC